MAPRSDTATPCEVRVGCRWKKGKVFSRDGHLVNVLYDGRVITVTEDDIREAKPSAYSLGEEEDDE